MVKMNNKLMILKEKETNDFMSTTHCHLRNKKFTNKNEEVWDHRDFTRKCRAAICN